MAAVAVEETVGAKAEVGELDFAVQSHMLLGVMQAAVEEGGGRWMSFWRNWRGGWWGQGGLRRGG